MKRRPARKSKKAVVPPKRGKRVRFPLLRSRGPKVNVTNEQIYELVGFP